MEEIHYRLWKERYLCENSQVISVAQISDLFIPNWHLLIKAMKEEFEQFILT